MGWRVHRPRLRAPSLAIAKKKKEEAIYSVSKILPNLLDYHSVDVGSKVRIPSTAHHE